MAYVKTNWANSPSTATPISATNLNHAETQYDQALADSKTYTDQQIAANPAPPGEIVGVSAVALPPGSTPTATTGGTPTQTTIEFGIPTGGVGETNTYLRQASLWSYGHSFTSVPNNYCRPNAGEHPLRIKDRIGFVEVKPFGRGNTPLPDTLANALNNSRVTDLNRNWPGLDTIASTGGAEVEANLPDDRLMPRGIVTIENYINEIGLGLTSPAYITFWQHCLRTLIATIGGKAQRAFGTAIGPVTNSWNEAPSTPLQNLFPKGQLPAGALARTNQIGNYREYRVRGDYCWVFVLATRAAVPSGPIDVYVGATKVQTLTPQGMFPADYTSVITESEAVGGWPIAIKVTGLNAAAGTTSWKTIQLRATTTTLTYMSVVLVNREQPPEVLVAYEPTRKDTAPATWATENAKYKAAIDTVVSEFPNANVVNLDNGWDNTIMTPSGNFHPNDRGQAKLADNYVEAINETNTAWKTGTAVL